ncbi:probable RNA-binding protein 28 [Coccomyxa sp. Obi]|nr:probable RNA-binding protein 28 [Coccomyxa sp. Obi]
MAEADATDPRTVFIKGISFDWDNSDFEKAVSDVGPVRKCFLLKGAGKHHKGCGFVTFALQEDAQRAIKELNGQKLGGRTIQVEAAQRRAPFAERKEKKRKRTDDAPAPTDEPAAATPAAAAPSSPTKPPPTAQQAASPTAEPKPRKAKKQLTDQRPAGQPKQENPKHTLVRTVALGNLSAANREQALAYAQSDTAPHSVAQPPQAELDSHALQRDGCAGDVAFLVYPTVKDALAAVEKLHNHVLRDGDGGAAAAAAAKGKKAKAGASSGTLLWARQVSGEGAHLKKWRLILRNLPFNVKEADLRELLSPAGFVWELTVPRNPDGKARGFGFAGFMCRAHAERAIKLANAKVVGGRTIAVDWAVPKAQFQSSAPAEAHQEEEAGAVAEDGVSDDEDDAADEERAASEEQDEGAAEVQLEDEKKLMRSVLSQLGEGDDDKDDAQPPPKGKKKGAKGEEQQETQQPQGEDHKKSELQTTQAPGGAGEGSAAEHKGVVQATVFVRGLPLDVMQYEVSERLSRYGKLKACRLVQDKGTKKLKGTAFVEFEQQEDAQAAAEACAKARAGQGPALTVRGVPIEVDLALTQDDARQLAGAGKTAAQPGKDNRNLYLLKEGQIEEGSPAWQAMSAADRAKRKRAAAEARTKLKSPNFFLSRTRLCLRNLPAKLSEKALKDLVLAAVKERAAKARPVAKQVKILRDTDKAGADGQAASKGLGFVELTEHEHALCALRQLNNNPVPFGTDRRPIVEFAIENAQTLKKREIRRKSIHTKDDQGPESRPSAEAAGGGVEETPGEEPAASKRTQRKRKRQEAKHDAEASGRAKSGSEAYASGQGAAAAGAAAESLLPTQQSKRRKRELRAAARSGGKEKRGAGNAAAQVPSSAVQSSPRPVPRQIPREGASSQQAAKQKPLGTQKKRAQTDEGGSAQPKGKRRKTEREKADKLDSLVTQYKAQLFGESAGKGAKGSLKSSMQRWFE